MKFWKKKKTKKIEKINRENKEKKFRKCRISTDASQKKFNAKSRFKTVQTLDLAGMRRNRNFVSKQSASWYLVTPSIATMQ
mgnify:CR=1 FL=1